MRLGLEADGGFEHFERRRIGGGIGAAGLAEDAFDLGDGFDQAIRLLEQLPGLGGGNAGQCRWHVQQVALVHLRHEFTAKLADRPGGGGENQRSDDQHSFGVSQRPVERRAVEARQPAVDRIGIFGRDAAADQPAHQHRDQRYRQQRGAGHRIGFGKRQRRKQPAFLPLEREHRDERKSDDQQAEKQRRADFDRRLGDDRPARRAGEDFAGVVMPPAFKVFMGVLDHHHGGIDHGADGNGNAAQRHDVGVHPLPAHDDDGDEHAER